MNASWALRALNGFFGLYPTAHPPVALPPAQTPPALAMTPSVRESTPPLLQKEMAPSGQVADMLVAPLPPTVPAAPVVPSGISIWGPPPATIQPATAAPTTSVFPSRRLDWDAIAANIPGNSGDDYKSVQAWLSICEFSLKTADGTFLPIRLEYEGHSFRMSLSLNDVTEGNARALLRATRHKMLTLLSAEKQQQLYYHERDLLEPSYGQRQNEIGIEFDRGGPLPFRLAPNVLVAALNNNILNYKEILPKQSRILEFQAETMDCGNPLQSRFVKLAEAPVARILTGRDGDHNRVAIDFGSETGRSADTDALYKNWLDSLVKDAARAANVTIEYRVEFVPYKAYKGGSSFTADQSKRESVYFYADAIPFDRKDAFWREFERLLLERTSDDSVREEALSRFDFETNLALAARKEQNDLGHFPLAETVLRARVALQERNVDELAALMETLAASHEVEQDIVSIHRLWDLPATLHTERLIKSWWQLFKKRLGNLPYSWDIMELGGFWGMPNEQLSRWLSVLYDMTSQDWSFEWIVDELRHKIRIFYEPPPKQDLRDMMNGEVPPTTILEKVFVWKKSSDAAMLRDLKTEIARQLGELQGSIDRDSQALPEVIADAQRDPTKDIWPGVFRKRIAWNESMKIILTELLVFLES